MNFSRRHSWIDRADIFAGLCNVNVNLDHEGKNCILILSIRRLVTNVSMSVDQEILRLLFNNIVSSHVECWKKPGE